MCGFFATKTVGFLQQNTRVFCRVYAGLIYSSFFVVIVDSNSLAFFMVNGRDNTDISERNTTELLRQLSRQISFAYRSL
jgi:hypothetical protein